MSSHLYRRYYTNDFWDRPSRTMDNFGIMDDPFFYRSSLPYHLRPRRTLHMDSGDSNIEHNSSESADTAINTAPASNPKNVNFSVDHHHADEKTAVSEVSNQRDKFVISIDVGHFAPEEIQVKVSDEMLLVEASHEEKMDEHGFVSRTFKRRYELPKDINIQAVVSDLTPDGILTIQAPKINIEPPKERPVPIQLVAGRATPTNGILKRKN